jgi:hypothetical protein
MAALLMVASQYKLNPFTKELYAFPDKNNGIVPVVGVDGWSRIINSAPEFDGMDFVQDDESCTCVIYRKDRSHPIKVTEWMSECKRSAVPWQTHPKRMLRHKAMIQCARLAFGFTGIYDQDEAERIAEAQSVKPEAERIAKAQTLTPEAMAFEDAHLPALTDAAKKGELALRAQFSQTPRSPLFADLWARHEKTLKAIAAKVPEPVIIDNETGAEV